MEEKLTSEQLQVLPELAILVALDTVIETAIDAMLAAHPELIEDEPNPPIPAPLTAPACAADAIVQLAATLQEAIDRYRRVTYHLIHFVPRPDCVTDPF